MKRNYCCEDFRKRNYCCEDFRLDVEDYKKITIPKIGFIRFSGSAINYCPFCGVNINGKKK